MVRGYGAEDGYWDVRAVRQIAAVLLDLKPGAEPAGGLRLDAYNFVYRSLNITANKLLNVCIPQLKQRALANIWPDNSIGFSKEVLSLSVFSPSRFYRRLCSIMLDLLSLLDSYISIQSFVNPVNIPISP
jgi:hypothetical protein